MRRADWLERLRQTLGAAAKRPFFYGACVQLCAESVDAVTGSSWAESVSPLYRTKEDALRHLAQAGGLEQLVSERLGPPTPDNTAREGDIVLVELPSGPAIGVCVPVVTPSGIWPVIVCAASPSGIECLPLKQGLCSWRVD